MKVFAVILLPTFYLLSFLSRNFLFLLTPPVLEPGASIEMSASAFSAADNYYRSYY